MNPSRIIKDQLCSHKGLEVAWISFSVFLVYMCMYMYRKPFTVGIFESLSWYGIDYKILLVLAQVLGYAISKVIGIKLIAELKNQHRIRLLIGLIGMAWFALVGLALFPKSAGIVCLFLNGLSLGLIWGIVFTFCEGRRFMEIFTVILSCNFILTSGLAKTFGALLIQNNFPEFHMPAILGILVFPIFLLSCWMLSLIPTPSEDDVIQRSHRSPLDHTGRVVILKNHGFTIMLFVIIYLLLTIIRDIRDNFASNIWYSLGYKDSPSIFTTTEFIVTLIILLILGLLYRVGNNYKALKINLAISSLGMFLLLISTILFRSNGLTPIWWMIISGVGLFLPYILLNGIIFDRFIATFSITGNVGYIMYLSDATGYLGSVAIMIFKNFFSTQFDWLQYFMNLSLIGGSIGLLLCISLYRLLCYKVAIHSLRKT